MSESRAVTRRDFIAGMVAALALCFAPLDWFVAWLGELLGRVYAVPESSLSIDYDAFVKILAPMFSNDLERHWNRTTYMMKLR